MTDSARCAAIVLAAGGSTRLGQPKQFVRVESETLLRRTVRLAEESGCSPVLVVLGENAEAFLPELSESSAVPVINEAWRSGMASSLRAGLSLALQLNPQQEAVMVLVCDQPRLARLVLRDLLLLHSLRKPLISASRYKDTLGVPAIFSSAIFGELFELSGDQGARRILQRHVESVAVVEFPGGELDLDTPEDLARL